MLYSGLPAIVLASFAVCATALSDLDGSVWANLDSKQSKRSFQYQSRNRPVKRASGWSPPSDLATPLTEVWDHVVSTYDGGADGNVNWGWHQVMANEGKLNICVRWDSNQTVTEAERAKIATVYNTQYQKWFKWVYGYNGFLYSKVDVNIVGWAVSDKSLLEGSTTGYDVYTDLDADGIPMCNIGCSRDAHLDSDYSACEGGADHHFDQSLWLTEGLDGGYGYSWGQQVGREYFMNNIDSENIHILLHEMGHTFGLDDFYDWTPTGVTNFIMLAGASMEITDFDGWMYRNWWYYLSEKNGWSSSSVVSASESATASEAAATTTEAVAEDVEDVVEEPTSTLKATSAAFSVTEAATTFQAVTTSEAPATVSPVAPDVTPFLPTPNRNSTPVATPSSTPSALPESGSAGRWEACGGGSSYKGATKCASGLKCVKHNDYYHQCL
ncbi:hypothetical protein BGZ61DRAFT_589040 [Ilyonectria robusta]|uniref:uncharacterized protein n=1 Tax=Ilyonectria robusta TaxID=1079257 RepID=UPI001E8D34DB|nr:uncharacterized protein BGZ61DRAFT_589040 [Ilyonectria robusta]KAH8688482.1 hypothetical protein BGZ61DRAFT_589040 [Ilyonectria robusta]